MDKASFIAMESVDKSLIEAVDHARYALYRQAPFFGVALARVEAYFTEQVETACIDGVNIWINPTFWAELTPEFRKGVLAHEVGHMLFGHLWRRGRREHMLSNIAMDHALNIILLDECGFQLPDWVLHDKVKYADKAWEEIYDMLYREQDSNSGSGSGLPGIGGDGSGNDSNPFQDRASQGKQRQLDTHAFWDQPDVDKAAQQEQHWKGVTTAAWMKAKQQGKLPAGIDRLVGDANKPKVDWYAALYRYIQMSDVSDESWNPPDRRFASEDIWFPADKPDETLRDMYACFDTSGSIGEDEMRLYLGSVESIMRNFPRTKGRLLVGDAAVHYEGDLDKYKLKKYPGGGGTDFRPFFDRVAENRAKGRPKPSALIFFTDAYGTFPETPSDYPVIWVVTSGAKHVPWGTVVHVDI